MFEMTAVVRNIPTKLYLSVKNKLLLLHHNVKTKLTKWARPTEQKALLKSLCKTFATIFVSAKTGNKTELQFIAQSSLQKSCICNTDDALLINHSLPIAFTKYRKLAEMDLDGNTQLTLLEFDDMTLEDIDYIEF